INNNKKFSEKQLNDLIDQLSKRFNYKEIVSNWKKAYGESQVKYIYYDQLKENPKKFLQDVCTFLEVDFERGVNEDILFKRVFKSKEVELLDTIKEKLINQNFDNMQN